MKATEAIANLISYLAAIVFGMAIGVSLLMYYVQVNSSCLKNICMFAYDKKDFFF